LLQKIDEGFQVIYIDGNIENNDLSNLALIEEDDLKRVRRVIASRHRDHADGEG